MADAPNLTLTVPENPTVTFYSATAGVFSLNGINGDVLLSGAGSVYLSQNNKTILISGSAMGGGGGTGAATETQLAATGTTLNLKIEALSGWTQNALTQSGANLIGIFNGTGVKSLNGGTGNLNVVGLGTVFVTRNGQDISISGMVSGGGGDVTFSQLTSTGLYLEGLIGTQSGFAAGNYATITNLFATGSNLNTRISQVSGSLTQTGVILGSQIANADGRIDSLSGYSNGIFATKTNLESTGLAVRNDLIGGDANLSGSLNSVSGALSVRLGATGTLGRSYTDTTSGGLQSQVAGTGQAVWTHSDNNSRNISGNLTQTGVVLGSQLSAVSSSAQNNAINLSGKLTDSGVLLGARIDTVTTNTQANATNISGNLTQTGVSLGARIDAAASNLTATGQRLTAITVTGSTVINSGDIAGLGGTLVILSGNKIWISGAGAGGGGVSSSQLEATGQAAWTAAQNNATNISGNLTQTGVLLGTRIDAVTTNTQANAVNISGNLTQTGVALGAQISATNANVLANANNLSGQLTASGQRISSITVTGSNIISSGDFIGIGGNQVILSGTRIFVSGVSDRLTQTGVALIALIGASSAGVSSINGASGTMTLAGAGNVSVTTAGQTITISGNTGAYASFATVENLTQTGVTLGSQIGLVSANAQNNAVNLSGQLTQTGVVLGSRIDAVTTSLQNNSANLSGALTATGQRLSALAITGSSIINSPNFTGIKGVEVSLSGTNVIVSGNYDHVTNTGVILGNLINTANANIAANANNLSGQFTQTGISLGARIDTVTTNTQNNAANLSGNLTQTGVSLGAQISTVSANTLANATNLSGNLTATGQKLSALTVTGSNVINSGDFRGLGGTLVLHSGNIIWISGAGGGGGGVSASQLEATGQAAWTAAQNNAANLSGNLTQTGILLGSRIDTVVTNTQNNATNISGNLTQTGVLLGSRIDTANTNIAANASNLSGNLTQTGVALGAQINTISSNTQNNAVNLSGNLNLTGQRLSAITVSGSSILNLVDLSGIGGDQVILSGTRVFVSGVSDRLTNTGVVLGGLITTANNNIAANAANLSGNLTQTGVSLGSRIDTVTTNTQNNATNLSGLLTQTGVLLGSRIDTSNNNIAANAANLSGNLTATGQRLSAVSVTGSSTINSPIFSGIGGTIVIQSGDRFVLVSGGAGGGGGVSSSQLESTGQALVIRDNNISGALTFNMSPPFISASGANITLNIDSGKGTQNLKIIATGGNTTLTLAGTYNGANGVIIIDKRFAGGGTLFIPSGSIIINGSPATGIPYSTGASGYDAYAFVCDEARSYWTANSLTGTASTLTFTGNYTALSVTGSNVLPVANVTGVGNVSVSIIGSTLFITGTAGAGGGVTQGQLDSLSGHVGNFYVDRNTAQSVTGVKTFVNTGFITFTTGRNSVPAGTALLINNFDGAPTRFVVDTYNSASVFGPSIRGRRARGTSADPSGLLVNDVLVQIAADGYISGFNATQGSLAFVAADNWTTGSTPTVFTIRTTPHASTSSVERVRVFASGEMGIGDFSSLQVLSDNPLAISDSGVFLQANIKNNSNKNDASSDWVATADNGTDTTNYIDVGINSSSYSQSAYSLVGPNDGYVYVNGGHLVMGTQSPGEEIRLHVGGTQSGNLELSVNSSGITMVTGAEVQFGNSLRLYQTHLAQKEVLSVMQSGQRNAATILGPALWAKQFTAILPATTTSQTVLGNTAANVGTLSTVSDQVFGQYTNYVTAAPVGSTAGTTATTAYYYRGTITGKNGFFFTSTFALTDGTSGANAYGNPSGSRIFIGMTDQAAAAAVALNDPAGNRVGLSYIWASGGASANRFNEQWQISAKNNTTEFTGNVGWGFRSGYYRFSMYSPPFNALNTGIYWQLEDLLGGSGTVGVVRDNLPIGTTALRPAAVIATMSGLKNLKTNNVYVELAN